MITPEKGVYVGRVKGKRTTFLASIPEGSGYGLRVWLTFYPPRGSAIRQGICSWPNSFDGIVCRHEWSTATKASPTRTRRFFALMRRDVNYRNQHPEASSGAGQGSTHKPDGEINMSRNTTTRLFAIASFNLGDTVSHLMEKKLIVGFRGFYKNPRISTWSSDDVTAIPPTTAPSIEYVLLGRDGRTVVAKKDAFTLVERYESIHDKLRLGVASAFEAAKVELDDMKAEWVTGRPAAVAPAPVAAPVADAVEAPAAVANTVTVTYDGITATITYTDAEDLYEKLGRLVG